MHAPKFARLFLSFIIILIFFVSILTLVERSYLPTSPTISVTATTDQSAYHLRQNVNVSGDLMDNDSPISNALISMEVRNPRGDPFIFRTMPIGDPTEEWSVTITDAHILDAPPPDGNPTDKAEVNSMTHLFVKVHNVLVNQITVLITATVYDGNLVPICARWSQVSILPNGEASLSWSCYIPEWAYCGKATVHYNVYNNSPKEHGTPYTPEKTFQFYITRNPELGAPYRPPRSSYTTAPGQYDAYFKVPPDPFPGDYIVHVTGRYRTDMLILTAYTSTTFNVQSLPCPPQAAFTYSPLKVYQNTTVTFDASSSSAEGYNDTITSYGWYINDPYDPEHIVKTSPTTTHTFEYDGTFTVELNVTDNEGLWSTTSKPITILPEFGPTANFTWTPTTSIINQTVTFDASSSTEGWSAKTQQFSPITTYVWNFSDGTGDITVTTPTVDHDFIEPGNFTVKLTIFDAVDRSDTISYNIEVQNMTIKDYDVDGDHYIDITDILLVALHYGTSPDDPDWDPRCDVNNDLYVDIEDILLVALHYGEDP